MLNNDTNKIGFDWPSPQKIKGYGFWTISLFRFGWLQNEPHGFEVIVKAESFFHTDAFCYPLWKSRLAESAFAGFIFCPP
jgi:hypothetical protein